MTIDIPKGANTVLSILEHNGAEAYVIGGCVRDSILGRTPHDWDICTNALPEKVKDYFTSLGYHVIETGMKHGTVTVMVENEPYEVTTYRVDGEYKDSRHPESVQFVGDLKADLARRDFTMNALAYNTEMGIVDYFNGLTDIRMKLIRCVGVADDRFNEDALRIMRAVRFASTYGFELDKSVTDSIHRNRNLLSNIAAERINVELTKALMGEGVGYILSNFVDVIGVFFPEVLPMIEFKQNNPHHIYDVWNHTIEVVKNAENNATIKLAALFHDIGKPHSYTEDEQGIGHFYGHAGISMDIAETVLKRLKFDNDTIYNIVELIKYHDADIQPRNRSVKRWLNKIGENGLRQLVALKRADVMAQSELNRGERLMQLDGILACVETIIAQQQCFSLKDLAVNGRDLMDAGVPQGVRIGVVLNELLDMVLDEQIDNNHEVLLKAVKLI